MRRGRGGGRGGGADRPIIPSKRGSRPFGGVCVFCVPEFGGWVGSYARVCVLCVRSMGGLVAGGNGHGRCSVGKTSRFARGSVEFSIRSIPPLLFRSYELTQMIAPIRAGMSLPAAMAATRVCYTVRCVGPVGACLLYMLPPVFFLRETRSRQRRQTLESLRGRTTQSVEAMNCVGYPAGGGLGRGGLAGGPRGEGYPISKRKFKFENGL